MERGGGKNIFLLDDFLTDFDNYRGRQLIQLIQSFGCQLIITATSFNSIEQLIGSNISVFHL